MIDMRRIKQILNISCIYIKKDCYATIRINTHCESLKPFSSYYCCDRGVSCNPCVWEASWCGYSWTVWVTMTWFWHFLNQHGTGAADSEGIRPETDTGNGWEAINWVSNWWEIMGRGSVVRILVRPKVPFSRSLAVSCSIGHRSVGHRTRSLNKDRKK